MDKVRRGKQKEVYARLDFRKSSRERRTREGHRRQSAFDRLSETYSPSTTKSRPDRTSSRDHSRGRSRPHRLDASNEDRPEIGNTSVALGSRMITLTPPIRRGSTTDIAITTETAPAI
nr:hypothetical protein [Tanacetum cinerariifolium]